MSLKKKLKGIKLLTVLGIGGACMFGLLYSVNSIKEAGDKLSNMSQVRDSLEEGMKSDISKNYALNDSSQSSAETQEVIDNMSKPIEEAKNNTEKPDNKSKEAKKESKKITNSTSYSQIEKLSWPLKGEIVKGYSVDKLVYFETLKSFRTNPAIFIGGTEGDSIKSACDGKVLKVGKDEELGHCIEVEIGKGAKVKYGQVNNIKVSEGDRVKEGQVIASLTTPTAYYTEEGEHLYFQVYEKDEEVDPMVYLK